jgi:membrane-associated protein
MQSIILPFLALWKPLGYVLVFLGMIFEGDFILFTTGFLTNQGFFDFYDIILIVVGGTLLGDFLWYELGRRLNNHTPGLIKHWLNKITGPIDDHVVKRPFHSILISKFTYGLHHILLARAGMHGVSFKEFFKSDLIATPIWIVIIGGLGYSSGLSLDLAKHYLKFVELALLLTLVLFVLLLKFISNRSRRRI